MCFRLYGHTGRSGFFLQYIFIVLRLQNLITSLKVVRFTFFYVILNKTKLSRTIKRTESVGEKRVQYFLYCEWDFSSKIRKLFIFAHILDKFCLQNLITSLNVVRFTSFFFYVILNKTKTVSRTIKQPESIGNKRVSRLGDRKHIYFFLPNEGGAPQV